MYKLLHLPTGTCLYKVKETTNTLYSQYEKDTFTSNREKWNYIFETMEEIEHYLDYSINENAFDFGDDFESGNLLREHIAIIEVDLDG